MLLFKANTSRFSAKRPHEQDPLVFDRKVIESGLKWMLYKLDVNECRCHRCVSSAAKWESIRWRLLLYAASIFFVVCVMDCEISMSIVFALFSVLLKLLLYSFGVVFKRREKIMRI